MKNTVVTIQQMKEKGEKISMLTAYDYSTAKLEDELFAPRYANPKKNIDDCCTFIINQVRSGASGDVHPGCGQRL